MAVFTTAMPGHSGDTKADVAELQAWARRLVSELRTVLYSLDRENVTAAGSVRAEDITGALSGEKLAEVPAEKISGIAPAVEVNAGNGIVFRLSDEDGSSAAAIYYKSDGENSGLHIKADNVYVNNVKLN
ncbi:MAG: hypothetical protein Q4G33_09390 [bacterium]|nr:hypothetical protein [bacterium]